MGKKITLRLLFVIALLVLSSVGVKAEARKFSSEINKKLKLLNKPAIKSIKVFFFFSTRSIDTLKFSMCLCSTRQGKLLHECSYCVRRKINLNLNLDIFINIWITIIYFSK